MLTVAIWGIVTAPCPPATARVAADGHVHLPIVARSGTPPTQIAGCDVFPGDNIWNTAKDTLPVHPHSDNYINAIGAERTLHADFGSGVWPPGSDSPIGIPFVAAPGSQPEVPVTFVRWPEESDDGRPTNPGGSRLARSPLCLEPDLFRLPARGATPASAGRLRHFWFLTEGPGTVADT